MRNQKNRSLEVHAQIGYTTRKYLPFMEKEMKKLQKKFWKEKEQLHAQFVPEDATKYMVEKEAAAV